MRKFLTILFLIPFVCYSQLSGAWLLNGNSNDASTAGNNGTDHTISYVACVGSTGGSFDGTASYIEITGNQANFKFENTTFTVSLWINTTITAAGDYMLITKGGASSTGGWLIEYKGTNITAQIRSSNGNGTYEQAVYTIGDGFWHNVTVKFTTSTTVLNNNVILIYIDGVKATSTTTLHDLVYTSSTATLQFGRRPTSLYYKGKMDDIRIYPTGLSVAAIKNIYLSQKGFYQ